MIRPMNSKTKISFLSIFAAIIIMSFGCGEKSTENVKNYKQAVQSISDCKIFYQRTDEIIPPDSTCVAYEYNLASGTLHFKHINSMLNCCISGAEVLVTEDNRMITIEEVEILDNGGCDCVCFYDLETEIDSIGTGQYHITFVNEYLNGYFPMVFSINLAESVKDTVCFGYNLILEKEMEEE